MRETMPIHNYSIEKVMKSLPVDDQMYHYPAVRLLATESRPSITGVEVEIMGSRDGKVGGHGECAALRIGSVKAHWDDLAFNDPIGASGAAFQGAEPTDLLLLADMLRELHALAQAHGLITADGKDWVWSECHYSDGIAAVPAGAGS